MLKVKDFVNGPFQENTFILYDETGSCVIIDPGMSNSYEQNAVISYLKENNLTPKFLLNTHCHIDHVLGNKFIFDNFALKPLFHKDELEIFHLAPVSAIKFGLNYEVSPEPEIFLTEQDTIEFGNTTLNILFAPGHSPAHICFYHKPSETLIGGDVLFYGSIGRTDLPGGNFETLIDSIRNKLFILPDETKVYPGHGPSTTIGFEKRHNPFLR